jgi:hypothetical protein
VNGIYFDLTSRTVNGASNYEKGLRDEATEMARFHLAPAELLGAFWAASFTLAAMPRCCRYDIVSARAARESTQRENSNDDESNYCCPFMFDSSTESRTSSLPGHMHGGARPSR